MSNPPAINFTIPFVPVAVHVVVNANGVQPNGTNVPVPDTTSSLVLSILSGATAISVAVDPSDNRSVIFTPGLLPPGGSQVGWSVKISVPGKSQFTTVSGNTPAPADVSGVTWDGNPVGPA